MKKALITGLDGSYLLNAYWIGIWGPVEGKHPV